MGTSWNNESARRQDTLFRLWICIRVRTAFLGIVKELEVEASRIFTLVEVGLVRVVASKLSDVGLISKIRAKSFSLWEIVILEFFIDL